MNAPLIVWLISLFGVSVASFAFGRLYPSRYRLPYRPSWRDRLAHRLASQALLVATPTYRALLRGAYLGGLKHATDCHPRAGESS